MYTVYVLRIVYKTPKERPMICKITILTVLQELENMIWLDERWLHIICHQGFQMCILDLLNLSFCSIIFSKKQG